MPRVFESTTIQTSPDHVWELVGDPAKIAEWVPALAGAQADSDGRVCTTADGGQIRERLLEYSDEGRFYVYEITSSPLPVHSYVGRISVAGIDGHAQVDWEADFEANGPRAGARARGRLQPDLPGRAPLAPRTARAGL